jgi:hypothetical protein
MSTTVETATEIRNFSIDVPREQLDDLRRRLEATRRPSKELVEDRSQGCPGHAPGSARPRLAS